MKMNTKHQRTVIKLTEKDFLVGTWWQSISSNKTYKILNLTNIHDITGKKIGEIIRFGTHVDGMIRSIDRADFFKNFIPM